MKDQNLSNCLQDDIVKAIDGLGLVMDSMFEQALTTCLDLQAELAQVKGILKRAEKCEALQDAEPGWNEQVHCRVLELALEDSPSVGFQNMYAFSPLPRYVIANLTAK